MSRITSPTSPNLDEYESTPSVSGIFNVGTGRALSICDIATALIDELKANVQPEIVGGFRAGDIRHCVADISKARRLLGYEPTHSVEQGIALTLDWCRRSAV